MLPPASVLNAQELHTELVRVFIITTLHIPGYNKCDWLEAGEYIE
jgi:hypothetical protein